MTAATHGRVDVVRWLLQAGVSPDSSVTLDQTPLHFAAYVGHAEVVALLLDHGADTAVREKQFDCTAAEWARETGEQTLAAQIDGASAG